MSIEQHVKAAGTNQITVVAGNYMRIADDFGSDVIESGGGGEAADDSLGGLAGGSGTSTSPQSGAARKDEDWWPGRGISPRLPGRGAAQTLTRRGRGCDCERDAGRELSRSRRVGYRNHSRPRHDALRQAAGHRHRYHVDQGADARGGADSSRGKQVDAARESRGAVVHSERQIVRSGRRAVGRTIETRGHTLQVVGVVRRAGGLGGRDAFDEIFIPYTALQDVLRITHLHNVLVAAEAAGESSRVSQDIVRVLRARHKLGPDDPDDFTVKPQARDAVMGKGINPMLARAVMGSVVGLDKITLEEMAENAGAVEPNDDRPAVERRGVSLLVGGIGIMNIMLVSVTERTREIGLRRAVGARSRDVLIQFLAEAVTLSMTGGLIGILLGVAASGSVGRFLRWTTVISPASIVIAAGVALAIGVFFGFYPARQASQLDPIDALRYE